MKPVVTTADEPGISTSEAQTRPPVQDSAVASVSFRILQRSSSARAKERISLALTLQAPHQLLPSHGSRMVALAVAAIPSSRPVKPKRSLVVAFTDTRDTGTFA